MTEKEKTLLRIIVKEDTYRIDHSIKTKEDFANIIDIMTQEIIMASSGEIKPLGSSLIFAIKTAITQMLNEPKKLEKLLKTIMPKEMEMHIETIDVQAIKIPKSEFKS